MNKLLFNPERLDELEMKVTFQEKVIEDLNQALVEQQFVLDKLQLQVKYLAQKLKTIQPSNVATQAEETPPPHY
ncbi:SlyX protein [Mergibacter septicus]|uniref:Protein SlyX homolog n=1 Tax=Mergibacter septicus TaxID=221402 RepID=A0A8E3MCF0_9PAST|nr:SlyX family protein [Mergibacter septicus]AWX14948.1 SlyX protein [Mergibacter septicus]QDJ12389.1 SlyX protein [Mergibacter septicus]QDJ14200.1 SlyX protein [Mergibacter septicus]UTU48353.1 SlyX family protein [Mergibacter septicus]WMR96020.1 SlyX family protein [Mergibacter septicus]